MRIPLPFPGPPLPLRLPEVGREEPEVAEDPGVEFVRRMRQEGYEDELIVMGLKVARNHLRTEAEAYQIGENYIREMAR